MARRARDPTGGEVRKQGLRARILGFVYSAVLRLQLATWRKEFYGLEPLDDLLARRVPVLVAFWHGRYVPLFAVLRGRRAAIFTSASFRGDVIAGICRRFGYLPVQLVDRGRQRSLEAMRRTLRGIPACGVAVDGPLGPYHAVKRGPVQLASELGLLVVPVTFAARRTRMARHRWDRMEVPRPFTRVVFLVGEPMKVPAGLDAVGVRKWAARLARELEALDAEAGSLVRGGPPVREPGDPDPRNPSL